MRLTAEHISRSFFRNGRGTNIFNAVEETDFTLSAGMTVLTGRSGSGKTTLINMLAGLLKPTQGSVLLYEREETEKEEAAADEAARAGVNLYSLTDHELARLRNRCFGIVPQGQTGLKSLTVLENITAPALMYGADREQSEKKALELLQSMDMEELTNVYADELSGGELRRMAIARALIREPQIIIADEPTGDLDDQTTEMVLRLLRAKANSGAAVLVVTHESGTFQYADRIFRMDKGMLTCADRS